MTISAPSVSSIARRAPTRTPSIRPVPKPTPTPMVYGRAAQRLAAAQGHAFADIAADLEAADANDVADLIDRRRDEHIRQALRLVKLARRDRDNAESYLALADGHLREAIRTDRIHDEHRQRGRRLIGESIEAGQAVVGSLETVLTGREPETTYEMPWPLEGVEAPGVLGTEPAP